MARRSARDNEYAIFDLHGLISQLSVYPRVWVGLVSRADFLFSVRPGDPHGEAVRRDLRDLKTNSFVGPGYQGDGFVLHSNLLFARCAPVLEQEAGSPDIQRLALVILYTALKRQSMQRIGFGFVTRRSHRLLCLFESGVPRRQLRRHTGVD